MSYTDGGCFLHFSHLILVQILNKSEFNGGYPNKCKEKDEIDLGAVYIPGQAKKIFLS